MARNYRETQIQMELCKYVRLKYRTALFNVDLSGMNLSKTQSGQAKVMRSGKGFPDFVLYEPKGKYHGLFIEIKKEGEQIFAKRSPDKEGFVKFASEHLSEQALMIEMLEQKGYYATFGVGMDECMKLVDNYMRL